VVAAVAGTEVLDLELAGASTAFAMAAGAAAYLSYESSCGSDGCGYRHTTATSLGLKGQADVLLAKVKRQDI